MAHTLTNACTFDARVRWLAPSAPARFGALGMAAARPARPVPPPRQRETYQGEFLDDLRHGKGTCTFADGAVYTGEWRVGAPHGTGRFVYASGDVFEGELNNRRRERGKLRWAESGNEYDGEWQMEVPHGEGTLLYAQANVVHSGQWAEGLPHGRGERRDRGRGALWRGQFVARQAMGLEGEGAVLHGEGEELLAGEQGERYAGHFDAGTRHGWGRLVLPDGSSWEGEWERGERRGQCTLLEPRSEGVASYTGGWAHGTRHGAGRQLEPDGSEYSGQWHRGVREGEGEQRGGSGGAASSAGGEVYRGQFLADQRHGRGALERPQRPSFEGAFEMGRQRGAGTLRLDDGGTVEGADFLDCELRGDGVRRWVGGESYRGPLDASARPEGQGVKTLADGSSIEAAWRAGHAEGSGAVTWAGGDAFTGELLAGEPSGAGRCAYADGRVYEGGWKGGAYDGEGKLRTAAGDEWQGSWAAGKLHGVGALRAADGARYEGGFLAGRRLFLFPPLHLCTICAHCTHCPHHAHRAHRAHRTNQARGARRGDGGRRLALRG